MSKPIFIQHSRFGLVTYAVSDTHLIATVKEDDKLVDYCVELRTLDPKYEVVYQSARMAVAVALVAAAVFGFVAWTILVNGSLGEWQKQLFVFGPFVGVGASLAFAARLAPRLELVVFKNHWGREVVVFVRERRQSAECMAFVDAFVARIELVQSDLDAESRAEVLRNFPSGALPITQTHFGVRKWKLAIVLGALATLIPLVPGANADFSVFVFMLDVLLSAGAATFAVISISNREAGRWMALFGLALAAVPVLFY